MRKLTSFNGPLLTALALFSIMLGCDEGSGPPATPELTDAGIDAGSSEIAFKILSPASGTVLTIDDDEDGDAENGLIGVSVRVAIPIGVKENIDLAINGIVTETLAPSPREVTFTVSLPGEESGTYALAVATTTPDGEILSDTVTVSVRVDGQGPQNCTLQVTPAPIGVCDIVGAAADEDPTRPLVQSTLTATSNCEAVEFTVNGISQGSVVTADGVAELQVTFREGENTVIAVAKDASEQAIEARQTLSYSVQTSQPSFQFTGLSTSRTNTFLIDDGERVGGKVYWTVTGSTDGVPPRSSVTIELSSDQDGAAPPVVPAQITTDAQGQFSFDLEIADGGFWEGSVKLSATDACMQTGESDVIGIQLDAAVPNLRIVSPGDGTTILTTQDADLTRAGVQVPVNVEVIDARPNSVDYEISIECAAAAGNRIFIDRTAPGDRVRRSSLRDADQANDAVIATFFPTEVGEFICQPKITTSSNPPVVSAVVWTTFFDVPTFTLTAPAGAPTCLQDSSIQVVGFGGNLDGNNPQLTVQVTPEDGEAQMPIALNALGDQRYEVRLDQSSLPDGRYTLALEGTIRGEIPVVFSPETRDIVVRRAAPTIDILSPADGGIFEDVELQTAGTQATVRVRVCNAGGRQLQVALNADGFMVQPLLVDIPAGETCAEVTTDAVAVPLGPVEVATSVTDECGTTANAAVTASTGMNEARIMMPAEGTSVNSSLDIDQNRPGCQVVVESVVGGIAEGAEMAVCTSFGQGGPGDLCDMASEANDSPCEIVGSTAGGARVRCAVTLQTGEHTLSFKARYGGLIESAPVAVVSDCVSPTVRNIIIDEDASADGCVNAAEAGTESAEPQQVTVQFETTDLPNGTEVALHSPEDQILGQGTITNNRGTIALTLPQGVTRFYVAGQDSAGNPLPGTQDENFNDFVSIAIDTQTPTPSFENLSNARCLVPSDDGDVESNGLQYAVRINTGHQPNEAVTAVMTLNAENAGRQVEQTSDDLFTFEAATLIEGSNDITVTVADGCGNVGSVNGFADVDGEPDPAQPLPISVLVDTVPPAFSVEGLVDGFVYTAGDDDDNDATNGFQTGFTAVFSGPDAIEVGQVVTVSVDTGPGTNGVPTDAIVEQDFDGTLSLSATISPGLQRGIAVEAADACGNVARIEPIRVDLDIQGCASRFNGFDTNPLYLGQDQSVNGATILDQISATVDLLDGACLNATVELQNNGNAIDTTVVGAGGTVTFENVALANGNNVLALLVTVQGADPLRSAEQSVFVDPAVPQLTFNQPADGAIIGSSANLSVQVTEPVGSERTAQLYIDGLPSGEPRPLADAADLTIDIPVASINEGARTLRVCVTDLAQNEGCASVAVLVDDGVPAPVGNVSVTVVDPRQTAVRLTFEVPDEDGANGGAVNEFEIRRVFEDFDGDGDGLPDNLALAEDAWNSSNAELTAYVVQNQGAVGASVDVDIVGIGPGVQWQGGPPRSVPSIDRGLPLDNVYYLAVRGRDDIGRLGEIRLVSVDLRLTQTAFDIPAPNGVGWGTDVLAHDNSPVHGIGDIDGDGFADALVTVLANNQSSASVVFGGAAGNTERIELNRAGTVFAGFFAYGGSAIGDVNNDGRPDFAVVGFQAGFAGTAISIYFGSNDRNQVAVPDSVIHINGFRSVVAAAGDFGRIAGGPAGIDDIFVGSKFNGSDEFALVIGGRDVWPGVDAPLVVSTAGNDPALGVTVLEVPDGQKTGYSASVVGDLNDDGFDTIALSAGNPTAVYMFDGQEVLPDTLEYGDGTNPAVRALPTQSCLGEDGAGATIVGGADLDGEGTADVIVSNLLGKRVMVLNQDESEVDCFGRSDKSFGEFTDLVGDINGDGFVDLIVSDREDEGDSGSQKTDAYIFYNDGTGQFGQVSGYANESTAPRLSHVALDGPNLPKLGAVGLGDFDGDTRDDVGVLVKQPGGNFQFIVYH